MKKFILFTAMLMVVVAGSLIAQEAEPIDLADLLGKAQIVFVSGIGGISVTALTELLKRLFKTSGVLSVLVSIGVAIACSAFYLVATTQFTVIALIAYSCLVAAVANGIFKFPKRE